MNVEILITAGVIEYDDETVELIKKDVEESIRKAISKFAGSKLGWTPYHENGVYEVLENIDHEVVFTDEGIYSYFSKKHNPEQYNDQMELTYGVQIK